MKFDINEQEELAEVSRYLLQQCQDFPLWIFKGEMGAGKTTLVKQICEDLEVIDIVNSPTFSIVNEYLTDDERSIYHFDFYRIKNEEEALDVGAVEYMESGELCLVEWPEKVSSLISEQHIEINIILAGDRQRKITVNRHG